MRNEGFRDYILDQLSSIEGVRARAMFSGYGLYLGDKFFGILSGDKIYFKTNDNNRSDYLDRGMEPFHPSPKQKLRNYYEVPEEIIENREELVNWARKAADTE